MSELNHTDPATIEPTSDPSTVAPSRRSKARLVVNILTQLFLMAILAVIIFIMWLPAIVSKK
ncbi:MAG: hypothetical protein H7Z14_10670 [Anaerolineae bacterium]|nr:hypothetical protein [Phycisphaerae bacterium]